MKRFHAREFVFLCAPIALIGAGILVSRAINPPRDPNAKIVLSLTRDANSFTMPKQLGFAWKARASGGPKDDYRFGFAQKLVASGRGQSQLLWSDVAPLKAALTGVNTGVSSLTGADFQEIGQNGSLSYDDLPVWTQKLEWQGEVVAVPQNSGTPGQKWGAVSPAKLKQWAQEKGAARVVKTFEIPLDAGKIQPIQKCVLEPVNASNAAKGADTCVTVSWRDARRKIFRRLVAFDGKTRRVLWSDPDGKELQKRIWQGEQVSGGGSLWQINTLFQLRKVPASWGEISFLLDAVFDPKIGAGTGETHCDAKEIARLKKLGWLYFSRRLTVRAKGKAVVAPNFPKTPNTQLLGVQTSFSPANWIVEARLRYVGARPNPELDSPSGPNFLDSNGRYLDTGTSSYGVKRAAKAGQWLAHIEIPRAKFESWKTPVVTLEMEIADTDAAPLFIKHQIVLQPNAVIQEKSSQRNQGKRRDFARPNA